MIAYTGELMYKNGDFVKPKTKAFEKLDILPRQRTDDIKVTWRR